MILLQKYLHNLPTFIYAKFFIFYFFADLLIGIQKETEAGRLPIHIAQGMEELYQNYRNAVS